MGRSKKNYKLFKKIKNKDWKRSIILNKILGMKLIYVVEYHAIDVISNL